MSVEFNEHGLALTAGNVTVFNFSADTREYTGSSDEYVSEGVGLPAFAALDAPLVPSVGFAVCRKVDGSDWEYLPDHRGEIVYSTETGARIEIMSLGDYPENVTPLKPKTKHDKWIGSEWITDTAAVHAEEVDKADVGRKNRLDAAKKHISLWQTQLQLGMISDTDKASLIVWMDYITALQAVDTSTAPDINWPTPPDA
ncbi:tail fiber assembly protein [Plesiomonas shigelloides]|uniref:tail fiber assembly protein n=1 Tax=Plesiomonas shigelloides TaxID=703 RepID=UPI001261F129|nr:tail fiber assembly protein [Plesiomonas shigelloides]KAB7666335.1 tail fiber assembly protein [Plesiomonas shigelloides]